jgi:hypothetical protein
MNRNVIKRMMTFDVIAKIPGKKDALGNTQYQLVECKGYPVDDILTIYDNLGKMVTSSMQLYVTGDDGLKIPSTAILNVGNYVTNGDEKTFVPLYENKPIIKRQIYYKPFGKVDVGVFYMP